MDTLELEIDEGIADRLTEKLYEFKSKWNRDPSHFILSPRSFLQLRFYMNEAARITCPNGKCEFHGVPVICGDVDNITLGIPFEIVSYVEYERTKAP